MGTRTNSWFLPSLSPIVFFISVNPPFLYQNQRRSSPPWFPLRHSPLLAHPDCVSLACRSVTTLLFSSFLSLQNSSAALVPAVCFCVQWLTPPGCSFSAVGLCLRGRHLGEVLFLRRVAPPSFPSLFKLWVCFPALLVTAESRLIHLFTWVCLFTTRLCPTFTSVSPVLVQCGAYGGSKGFWMNDSECLLQLAWLGFTALSAWGVGGWTGLQ